jgi:hypothetical protein
MTVGDTERELQGEYRWVAGPAEFAEVAYEASEGQADDVKVAAFDARDVASGSALDSVGAGFVVWLVGGEIGGNFVIRERIEIDQRRVDKFEMHGVREANKRNACEDRVRAAGELFEHAACVVSGARLAEDFAIEDDHSVRGDDDGRADRTGGDEFGFRVGEAEDEVVRRFAGGGSLVDGGGEHGKRNASVAQNFSAAGRSGSENQFHVIFGGEEYYNSSAERACALVQPKSRAN